MRACHAFKLADEAALLQHAERSFVVRVAQSEQFQDLQRLREADYRVQCFRGKAETPGIFRKHITGHGALRTLESESCTAQQASIVQIFNQVRAGGPALPFEFAVCEKRTSLLDGSMPGPAKKPCDLEVGSVAAEDWFSIREAWLVQQQARGFQLLRCVHDCIGWRMI